MNAVWSVSDAIRREYQEERAIERPDRGATYASRLRAGETLFFEGRPSTSFGTYCPMAKRFGMRVVTRRAVVDESGTLVWLEPAP